MSQQIRPSENPFNAQRLDSLRYVEFDHRLSEIATRLKRHGYRGAIVGPHGCGKSAMLQALGEELMGHGLSPLPLFVNSDQRGTLPQDWQRTIRKARHTDALLLDGYDLLPAWARLWVLLNARHAGAVLVTAHQDAYYKPIARPISSPCLLRQLIESLCPSSSSMIDANRLFHDARGNLRDALRNAYDLYPQLTESRSMPVVGQMRPTKSRRAG